MSVELPDSYESIYQRAMVQMASGNKKEAIESLLRIINRLRRLRPETLNRRPNLQNTLDAACEAALQFLRWDRQYDRAISVAESVLDRLPDPDMIRRQIASLLIEKGEVEEGLARMREIAEANQDFISWADLGAEYRVLKQYEQAEAAYKTALRHAQSNENAALANMALLSIYQDLDRVDDALDVWDMAVVLNSALADSVFQAYAWLIRRGHLERARKYLDRERHPLRRQFYEGLIEWKVGNQDAARQAWRRVVQVDVEAEDPALAVWIEAALRLGEAEKADERLEKVVSETQMVPVGVIVLRGIAKLMLGDVEQAIEEFGRVLERLQRAWPSRDKIPADRWELLTALVPNAERQDRIKDYFESSESKG
jgi:tetratricopeptide (TPR) repeat protein